MPPMSSRRSWIAAFIGHVLRSGLAVDPDWAYDVAEEAYPAWLNCDPGLAADSTFGTCDESPAKATAGRTLH